LSSAPPDHLVTYAPDHFGVEITPVKAEPMVRSQDIDRILLLDFLQIYSFERTHCEFPGHPDNLGGGFCRYRIRAIGKKVAYAYGGHARQIKCGPGK
jgi:hypothetical protein